MDDPYKTIVGDDGGLYYEYGTQGPEEYNNGQGSFGTRVLAGFVGNAQGGPLQQSLYSPRVPIVISERAYGQWLVRQQAWSNQMRGTGVTPTGADRVDYLTISACNQGTSADAGQVTLDVGSNKRLVLDQSRLHLLIDGRADQVFCQFSVPCEPLASEQQTQAAGKTLIRADAAARVQKNWAQPKGECASCFQHVLVGFGQPLVFRVDVEPGSEREIVLGLIEGWHAEPALFTKGKMWFRHDSSATDRIVSWRELRTPWSAHREIARSTVTKCCAAYLQGQRAVYPVNPSVKAVEGLAAFPNLASLPQTVHGLSIITPPRVTEQVVARPARLGIRHIWMQPGSENTKRSNSPSGPA